MERVLLDRLYVLGLRINHSVNYPEFYTLVVDEEYENIVTADGSVLFVSEVSKINLIFDFLDAERKAKYALPIEMEETIDLAGALFRLENEEEDENAIVLECLNTTFDLLKAINVEISENMRKSLYALADHLTFSTDLAEYFDHSEVDRGEIIDGLMWCFGKILSRTKILK